MDRISGALVMAFALGLWVFVIPDQVDAADYGWMRPRTLPQILAVTLLVLGALLVLLPSRDRDATAAGPAVPVAIGAGLAGGGVLAMGLWGFALAAPALALAAAVFAGERRWPWLLATGIAVPAAIWALVTVFLGRPLP